ncbi:aconitase iron-sulfur domain-containing protein [Fomitiporia mediterranea MF3/22]|uniref:aconitase iron-sulfur domain-containing protein n=1 Tax=Fomitiporia mediterranea (strain MF3/22) TaxID=694068 RepID=UPI000440750D|nr:aconitase iron-sulfur domain-containing protein [Fomitiporia mediterranea MF3/22]EJD08032.1 aconitase iron-sulfur domain-containing protein [Fomitiporia mediterranea MF3/22]
MLGEKVLYKHFDNLHNQDINQGKSYLKLRPDITCQDVTVQMTILQFMSSGMDTVTVTTTVYYNYLIHKLEVYDFLATVTTKVCIIGIDSYTPNADSLGMVTYSVRGADTVNIIANLLNIILKVTGILTVKGSTSVIVEYYSHSVKSLLCTSIVMICNIGADNSTKYDQLIEINLSELKPHINSLFIPNLTILILKFLVELKVGLISSCTNSLYKDMTHSVAITKEATDYSLQVKSKFLITSSSKQVCTTIVCNSLIETFENDGGIVLTNDCQDLLKGVKNSIITLYNCNFTSCNNTNPTTYTFVTSLNIVTTIVFTIFLQPSGNKLLLHSYNPSQNTFQPLSKDYISIQVVIDLKSDCLAINTENGKANKVKNKLTGEYSSVLSLTIITKSFVCIYETNLKKQSMLTLTFVNPEDYNHIKLDNKVTIKGLESFTLGKNLVIEVKHSDRKTEEIELAHLFNEGQIE